MDIKDLDRILDNSSQGFLEDQNGWKVPVIAFASSGDAGKVWRFLHDLRDNMAQFDETKRLISQFKDKT